MSESQEISPDATVWEAVEGWLVDRIQQDLATTEQRFTSAQIAYLCQHMTELSTDLFQITSVAQQCPVVADAALLLALVALKPKSAPVQGGASVWQFLSQRLHTTSPAPEPLHALGLVIAYGCGWSRTTSQAPADTWEGKWTHAVVALTEFVASAWRYTLRQVEQIVPPDVIAVEAFQSAELTSRAAGMALDLLHNHQERPEHRLASWNPAQSSLLHFVYDAVAGCRYRQAESGAHSPQGHQPLPRLQGGAFRNSLGFQLLQEDVGIMVNRVEFQVCPHCHADLIKRAVQHKGKIVLSELDGLLEPGGYCPRCRTAPVFTSDNPPYRIARNNWIFVPYEKGGHYEQVTRWRCPGCGSFYPAHLALREQITLLEEAIKTLRHTKTRDQAFARILYAAVPNQAQALLQQSNPAAALLATLKQHVADLRQQDAQAARCPLCHCAAPQRPSSLWCRTAGRACQLFNFPTSQRRASSA